MNQIARNLTDASDGFLQGCRYLIQDQSLDNKILKPDFAEFPKMGAIRCRTRLGGMLRYYYRDTA